MRLLEGGKEGRRGRDTERLQECMQFYPIRSRRAINCASLYTRSATPCGLSFKSQASLSHQSCEATDHSRSKGD